MSRSSTWRGFPSTRACGSSSALGIAIEWIQIDGNGPNALDFHIACHLGEGIARTPQTEFVIVSRDTGFDPLLRYMKARGLRCRREAPAATAKVEPQLVLDANAKLVVELLRRMEKNKMPRKRKTLTNHLVNHFQRKLSPEQVASAITQLVRAKLIAGTDAVLVYQI
jgi:hypothetical protein